MESVFAALKVEQVHHCSFSTREQPRRRYLIISRCFIIDNACIRRLGYRTPAEARASVEGVKLAA